MSTMSLVSRDTQVEKYIEEISKRKSRINRARSPLVQRNAAVRATRSRKNHSTSSLQQNHCKQRLEGKLQTHRVLGLKKRSKKARVSRTSNDKEETEIQKENSLLMDDSLSQAQSLRVCGESVFPNNMDTADKCEKDEETDDDYGLIGNITKGASYLTASMSTSALLEGFTSENETDCSFRKEKKADIDTSSNHQEKMSSKQEKQRKIFRKRSARTTTKGSNDSTQVEGNDNQPMEEIKKTLSDTILLIGAQVDRVVNYGLEKKAEYEKDNNEETDAGAKNDKKKRGIFRRKKTKSQAS